MRIYTGELGSFRQIDLRQSTPMTQVLTAEPKRVGFVLGVQTSNGAFFRPDHGELSISDGIQLIGGAQSVLVATLETWGPSVRQSWYGGSSGGNTAYVFDVMEDKSIWDAINDIINVVKKAMVRK